MKPIRPSLLFKFTLIFIFMYIVLLLLFTVIGSMNEDVFACIFGRVGLDAYIPGVITPFCAATQITTYTVPAVISIIISYFFTKKAAKR